MSKGLSAASRNILHPTGSSANIMCPTTSVFLQLCILSIIRVVIIKGLTHFRDLTFHLADRQVPAVGPRPIGDEHLFKPQW